MILNSIKTTGKRKQYGNFFTQDIQIGLNTLNTSLDFYFFIEGQNICRKTRKTVDLVDIFHYA